MPIATFLRAVDITLELRVVHFHPSLDAPEFHPLVPAFQCDDLILDHMGILQVLVEIGGSGKTKIVLDRVGDKMKNVLKPLDYEFLKSDGKSIRWRNSAQWARNTMVNEDGRMVKSGKNGVWEISEKGRKWLKEHSPRK